VADLELDRLLGRHGNGFKSLGILGHARGAVARLEDAEIPELDSVAFAQLADHMIEKALNGLLHDCALLPGLVGDTVDQILLRGRRHVRVPPVSGYDSVEPGKRSLTLPAA